jgi:hypothetical protein
LKGHGVLPEDPITILVFLSSVEHYGLGVWMALSMGLHMGLNLFDVYYIHT